MNQVGETLIQQIMYNNNLPLFNQSNCLLCLFALHQLHQLAQTWSRPSGVHLTLRCDKDDFDSHTKHGLTIFLDFIKMGCGFCF